MIATPPDILPRINESPPPGPPPQSGTGPLIHNCLTLLINYHLIVFQMDSVGICGSDIHFYTYGAIGDFIIKSPLILGHEGSGIVSK